MEQHVKGTVTSLSSVYAPEDAQKASVRVQETILERQQQIQQLQSFLNDNNNLINLVKKLPDQLHHDIMVLLGEGYYAERTSKQTIEILKRRGKDLESQIETLKAIIKDLKFEASFFDETATEAAEGIVEIREDYVDEVSNEDEATTAGEDDFARILSRMDELEKQELESEFTEEGEEEDTPDLSHHMSRTSLEPEIRSSEVQMKKENSISQKSLPNQSQQDVSRPIKAQDSPVLPVFKDSHVKVPTSSGSNASPRLLESTKLKESVPPTPVLKNEDSTLASNSSNDNSKSSVSKEVSNFGSGSGYDTSKASVVNCDSYSCSNTQPYTHNQSISCFQAFTGSIVEHTHNIEKSQKGQTAAPAPKPVSRFKLQRK